MVSYVIDKKYNSVLCSQNTIHNDLNITNNNDVQSCETPRKQNHRITTTSTPNQHAQRIGTMLYILLNLNTPTKLPPVGKAYMCFHIDGKYSQTAKCVKSGIINKIIYCVILIGTF